MTIAIYVTRRFDIEISLQRNICLLHQDAVLQAVCCEPADIICWLENSVQMSEQYCVVGSNFAVVRMNFKMDYGERDNEASL
jgi:hypothetical protein